MSERLQVALVCLGLVWPFVGFMLGAATEDDPRFDDCEPIVRFVGMFFLWPLYVLVCLLKFAVWLVSKPKEEN